MRRSGVGCARVMVLIFRAASSCVQDDRLTSVPGQLCPRPPLRPGSTPAHTE
jgi:hypothetical protein